jgi:hypothetical protein
MAHRFFRQFTTLFRLLGIALVLTACTPAIPSQVDTPQNTLPAIDTLVATSSPKEANCSSLRSIAGSDETAITFVNSSGRAIHVYWVDYQGAEQFWFELQPGQSQRQETFVTHPWCVRDKTNNTALLAVVATRAEQFANIAVSASTVTIESTPRPAPSPSPEATAVTACPGTPPFLLKLRDWARVSLEPPLPSRVRERPGTNGAVVGQIQPGEDVLVIDGPRCADGYTWWKVRSVAGLEGWTIEGDEDGYWLVEPISPWTSLPALITSQSEKTLDLREIRMTVNTALIRDVSSAKVYYLAVPPARPDTIERERLYSAYSEYQFTGSLEVYEFNVIDIETPDSRYYLGSDYVTALKRMLDNGQILQTALDPFLGSAYYGAPTAFLADTKIIEFKGGKGVRYLFGSTNAAPASNPFIYYFQGISDDGRYYIYASFGVNSEYLITFDIMPGLEKGFGPFAGYTSDDFEAALKSYEIYHDRIERLLEANLLILYPDLDLLDAMLSSMEIKPEAVSWEIPPDVCRDNWSRLITGTKAVVIASFEEGLKTFKSPSAGSALPTQMNKGEVVEILEGPVCKDSLVFWKAKDWGWVAEGDKNVYWLQPIE